MLNKFIKYLSVLSFYLIPSLLFAQEKPLEGMIVVDFRDDHPQGVIITNQSTKVYSVSDITGSFKLNASVGDTLLFRAPFLIDRKFVVRKSSFAQDPLIVHMNYEVITLADIVVKPPLTGDLKKDMKSVKVREDVEKVYANLGIDIRTLDMQPKEKREQIVPINSIIPIPTSLNIEALYKSITGYYRRMENLDQFERLERRMNNVKNYLSVKFFENTLEIPENEIRGFLLYAYDHSEGLYESFYLQQDYLSLEKLLIEKAPIYKRRLEVRDQAK